MVRRLPIYLLLDVSGSMGGEPITAVQNGLSLLISELRTNPKALETAFISIITFESTAQQLIPLTPLPQFQEPSFSAGGGTSMGEAVSILIDKLENEVNRKGSGETKGDWKPLVFILTDGQPTDDLDGPLSRLNRKDVEFVVAFGAGNMVEEDTLLKLAGSKEYVIFLDEVTTDRIQEFFKWVSQSIQTSIDPTKDELPPKPGEDDGDGLL